MRKNIQIVLTLLFLLGSSLGGSAIAQKAKQTSTHVTTTIQGTVDEDGASTYRLQSDQLQLGQYKYGENSVISEIQATYGDWVLDMKGSTVRKVYLDFRDPVASSHPNLPFQTGLVAARLISKCSLFNNDLRTMRSGDVITCPLSIAFDLNGYAYTLRMNDNNPGTDYVVWTCTGEANQKCMAWRMEPGSVYGEESKSIAQLNRSITVRGKTTTEDLGKYYISFLVNVTNP